MTLHDNDLLYGLDGSMPLCLYNCLTVLANCRSVTYCAIGGQARCVGASVSNRSRGLQLIGKHGCSYTEWTCIDDNDPIREVFYLMSPFPRPTRGHTGVSSLLLPSRLACAVACNKRKCTSFDYITAEGRCYFVTQAAVNLRYSIRISPK
ncbi:hypothetical protein LSAT2_022738 [Lamellibrachia satsuma]|nr:hypothetical protein LSAT2_022738 [Lamellibrachia satsuma]